MSSLGEAIAFRRAAEKLQEIIDDGGLTPLEYVSALEKLRWLIDESEFCLRAARTDWSCDDNEI